MDDHYPVRSVFSLLNKERIDKSQFWREDIHIMGSIEGYCLGSIEGYLFSIDPLLFKNQNA
ncbi:VAMP-like protein YKT61 [Iris pallida]|uniref:VAMP-like protein YKT61 n=1 Tax=Iris pallida TaxID=29817 RepID=A0AAX6G0Z7_IRIPA|nr:VAMP-like protein YKT61 [Iris pallida]